MDPAAPTPLDDALAQLGKLVAAGVAPERITQEVGAIIASWASEADMDAATAQDRIEQMWDGFGKDAADLQAAISDADQGDAGALAGAERTLAALQAAVAALAAAHERL